MYNYLSKYSINVFNSLLLRKTCIVDKTLDDTYNFCAIVEKCLK